MRLLEGATFKILTPFCDQILFTIFNNYELSIRSVVLNKLPSGRQYYYALDPDPQEAY